MRMFFPISLSPIHRLKIENLCIYPTFQSRLIFCLLRGCKKLLLKLFIGNNHFHSNNGFFPSFPLFISGTIEMRKVLPLSQMNMQEKN